MVVHAGGHITDGESQIHIGGNVSGQVAIGEFVYQAQAPGGVVNQIVVPEPIRALPRPVHIRPRRNQDAVERPSIIAGIVEGITTGPVQIVAEDGWGKTSVLTQLAYQPKTEEYRDGVAVVSAWGLGVEDVEQAIFEAFYESTLPDTKLRATQGQLRTSFADVSAAIVVDDLDIPRQHVDRVIDGLPECGFVSTASTQTLWSGGTVLDLVRMDPDEALKLFEQRLGRSIGTAESDEIVQFVSSVAGYPMAIVAAAAAVRRGTALIDVLPRIATAANPVAEVHAQVKEALSVAETKVLSVLSAVRGAPLPPEAVGAAAGVSDAEQHLDALKRDGIIQAASPRYRLPEPTASLLELPDAHAATVSGLTAWSWNESSAHKVASAGSAITIAMRSASERSDHAAAIELGRSADAGLSLSGRWGLWSGLLAEASNAAEHTGDAFAQSWSLHQLGTRSLVEGNVDAASVMLHEAADIRRRIGDTAGLEVTEHNIGLLAATPPVVIADSSAEAPGAIFKLPFWIMGMIVAGIIAWLLLANGDDPTPTTTFAESSSTTESGTTSDPDAHPPTTTGPEVLGGIVAIPSKIDFRRVLPGSSPTAQVALVNNGQEAVRIEDVTIKGHGAYSYATECGDLEPRQSCIVEVTFQPGLPGDASASVIVNHTAESAALVVPVSGSAAEPPASLLAVNPGAVDFGSVGQLTSGSLKVGDGPSEWTRVLTVANEGDLDISVEGIRLNTNRFVHSSDCSLLGPGDSCTIDIGFLAVETGQFSDTMTIEHSAKNPTLVVPVSGSVLTPPPPPPPPPSPPPPVVVSVDWESMPSAVDAVRLTTAESFTQVLAEGEEFLDADFGIGADPEVLAAALGQIAPGDLLPATGLASGSVLWIALSLLLTGGLAVLVTSGRLFRRNDGVARRMLIVTLATLVLIGTLVIIPGDAYGANEENPTTTTTTDRVEEQGAVAEQTEEAPVDRPIDSTSIDGSGAGVLANVPSEPNPPLSNSCGLNIALVFDRSNSVKDFGAVFKDAAKAFVDALQGTPSMIGLTDFAGIDMAGGVGIGEVRGPMTEIATVAGANTVKAAIDAIPFVDLGDMGGTNWQDGFKVVGGTDAPPSSGGLTPPIDVILFMTDGNPSTHDGSDDIGIPPLEPEHLDAGVVEANIWKLAGTRIIAVGIGEEITVSNLVDISGPTVNSDYFLTNFDTIGDGLEALAIASCTSTITITKHVDDNNDGIYEASDGSPDWTFEADATQSVGSLTWQNPAGADPVSDTVGTDGLVLFDWLLDDLGATTDVDITETVNPGWQYDPQTVCTIKTFEAPDAVDFPVTENGTGDGFTLSTIPRDGVIACDVFNTIVESSLELVKTGTLNDGGDGVDAGDTITYVFTVTNTGDSTVTGITINETVADVNVMGGPIDLIAGEVDSTTFTGQYVITQADIDAGEFENCATAEGTAPDGTSPVISAESCTTETFTKTPDIDLIKTGTFVDESGDGFADVGETISYTFAVENTGDVELTDVTLVDIIGGVIITGGPIASMAPGDVDSTTYTGTYAITQVDIDNATFHNVARVTGTPPGGDPDVTDDDDEDTPLPQGPAISIVKTPDLQEVFEFEDAVFTIDVTNTGNVTLHDVAVTDALAPDCDLDIGILTPGATTSYECTFFDAVRDFTNIAVVTGTPPQIGEGAPDPVTDEDDADVIVLHPVFVFATGICLAEEVEGIVLDRPYLAWETANWPEDSELNMRIFDKDMNLYSEGDAVSAEGAMPWPGYDDSGFDPETGIGGIIYPPEELRPIHIQIYTNPETPVTLVGYPPASDGCTPNPAIEVLKDVAPGSITVGEATEVTWTVTVTNTGDSLLSDVELTDELVAACALTIGNLDAGESVEQTCTATYTADTVEWDFVNVAVATGIGLWGTEVTDDDDASLIAGESATCTIGDTVWHDENENGIQDGGEKGIPDVTVELTKPGGETDDTMTNEDGMYIFEELPCGELTVKVLIESVCLALGVEVVSSGFFTGLDGTSQNRRNAVSMMLAAADGYAKLSQPGSFKTQIRPPKQTGRVLRTPSYPFARPKQFGSRADAPP